MEWVVILGLILWVWLQSRRIDALARRLEALAAPSVAQPATAPPPAPANTVDDVLVLDTPLPSVSNDIEFQPPPRPPAEITELRPAPSREPSNRRLERWLAENGLAWAGGATIAIGAILLVAFASQAGFFTPARRLIAAVALGGGLIGASEWMRRGGVGHPLLAALLAGAGASTLYAAIWAAHGLFGFIDWPLAAALLLICALVLVALANWHGQALGVLAIAAALVAPALASQPDWPGAGLTLFLCAVGAAGAGLAALKRWPWAAAIALLGLYAWFAAAIAQNDLLRALALLIAAGLSGLALIARPSRRDDDDADWSKARALLPTAALCTSSVLMVWIWGAATQQGPNAIAGPALAALLLAGLSAFAVRARVVAAPVLAVAIGALVFGYAVYASAQSLTGQIATTPFWPLLAAAGVAVSTLGARPHRSGRLLVAIAGAAGAAALVVLGVFQLTPFASPAVWAPLIAAALLLVAAAHLAARDAPHPERDGAVDAWVIAAGVTAVIGAEALAPAMVRPTAHAALALAFAALTLWRGWRGAGLAALGCAALALAHAVAPDFAGAALGGAQPLSRALLSLGGAAAFLLAAADLAGKRQTAKDVGESLGTAALLAALLGGFLVIRWAAAGGVAQTIDIVTETALHALMFLAAGFLTLPRRAGAGVIAQARSHALLGLGLATAVLGCALLLHSWWGLDPQPIVGPPVFNANLLGLAAPAAFALATARELYGRQIAARWPARCYASAGGVLALVWAVSELRRAFHPVQTAFAEIGLLEGCVYGLLALATPLAAAFSARMRAVAAPARPFTQDLQAIMRGLSIAGILVAAWFLLIARNPWWGAHDGAVTDAAATGLAILALGAASALALTLGRAVSRGADVDGARFAAAAAALVFALAFGHAGLRWLHQLGAMDDQPAQLVGLEGFAHALWPLAFVLAGGERIVRAQASNGARAYLEDIQAIFAAALWPALLWCALTLWIVFNPWWGTTPGHAGDATTAALGLAALLLAAWLSALSPRTPGARFKHWLEPAATIAATGHLFVAFSLVIRRSFHGAEMNAAIPGSSLETWTYSAAWAAFGALALSLGLKRQRAALTWCGLGVLGLVIGKVFVFDMAALSGVVRAASFLALGGVLVLATLAARRLRPASALTTSPE